MYKRQVWVLLTGMMLGAFLRMIWTHVAFRDKPMRWAWDAEIATDMWIYGRWLILSSMAGFVVNQGDRLILGAFLDKTLFGVYVIATLWMDVGQQVIGKVTGQVTAAGFAETLRTDRARFPAVFRKVHRVFNVLAVIAFLAAFFVGPIFIAFLYTPEYAGAGWMLSLLAFRFLSRRNSTYSSFLLVDGHSKSLAATTVIAAIGIGVLLPLIYSLFGLAPAILTVALAPMLGTPLLLCLLYTSPSPRD